MSEGTGHATDTAGGNENDRWFYARDGQRHGPVRLAALHALVAEGRVRPADLVWRAGMDQWEPASAVTLLWSASPAVATAVASPAPAAPAFGSYAQPAATAAAAELAYGVTHPAGVVYAGWGQRLGAWVIDWLVLLVVRFLVAMAMGLVVVVIEGRSGKMSEDASALFGLTVFAAWYLCAFPYYALMEASRRRGTLGKLAVGIQVDDADGGPATLVQTSVRFFLRLISAAILGVGFLMPLFTTRRQALHDLAANTIVTVKPPAAPGWQHPQHPQHPAMYRG